MTRKVWYVHAGMESPERFELLVSLTSLRSENQINALRDHLVKCVPIEVVMVLYGITNKSNLERDLDKVNDVATTVEKIKECDWAKFKAGLNGQK